MGHGMRKLITSIGPKMPHFFLKGNSEQGIEKEGERMGPRAINKQQSTEQKQEALRVMKDCSTAGSLPKEKSHPSFE